MPRKGQSCRNCAGDCCSYVSFVQPDTSSPLHCDIMDHSVQELRQQGFHEVKKRHIPCPAKSVYGCSIYEHRPRLCRSYFCFGRYWRPAPVMSRSNITQNILSTHQRRLQKQLLRKGINFRLINSL
ncbi:MAG: YkgJ family cysteine cluster protein [Candidatus Bathyarchaeota archaeon]|nr:YkgJ family cysteine cluster protein [Candidatus Bathyarchaeota archaeon]